MNIMTATLRLIPLTIEECRALMKNMGKPTTDETKNPGQVWVDECNRRRSPIQLKLCSVTDDIIDIDGDDIEHDIFRYASTYEDGRYAAVVSLGRNRSTGIKWGTVSRALCDVSLASKDKTESGSQQQSFNKCIRGGARSAVAYLTMRKAPGNHAVYLDGDLVTTTIGCEIPLEHGSIISLFLRTGFAYQVNILNNDNDAIIAATRATLACTVEESPIKRQKVSPLTDIDRFVVDNTRPLPTQISSSTTTSTRQLIRERAHKAMESEFTCAMCFDVLVKSNFAFPCSHAFCEECSMSVTNAAATSNLTASIDDTSQSNKGTCPTCRGTVKSWMPARSYDAMIWSYALQGFLDRSDAEYYLERREQAGEDAPTEEERGSIMNITSGEEIEEA